MSTVVLLLLTVLARFVPASCVCPLGGTFHDWPRYNDTDGSEGQDVCVNLFPASLTWTLAQAACPPGSGLVTFRSGDVDTGLFSFLRSTYSSAVFDSAAIMVGCHQASGSAAPNSGWVWVDSGPTTNLNVAAGTSLWGFGQPDDSGCGGSEGHCEDACMIQYGALTDGSSSTAMGSYICQIRLPPSATPGPSVSPTNRPSESRLPSDSPVAQVLSQSPHSINSTAIGLGVAGSIIVAGVLGAIVFVWCGRKGGNRRNSPLAAVAVSPPPPRPQTDAQPLCKTVPGAPAAETPSSCPPALQQPVPGPSPGDTPASPEHQKAAAAYNNDAALVPPSNDPAHPPPAEYFPTNVTVVMPPPPTSGGYDATPLVARSPRRNSQAAGPMYSVQYVAPAAGAPTWQTQNSLW